MDLLDDTALLIGPETPALINNQIMALTTQGVVAVSDSGVSILSRPIEADILPLFGSALSTVKTYAYGIGYETDRKYILSLPGVSTDTKCTQSYIYNTFTNAWTRWTLDTYCGAVNASDDKLYLGFDTKNTLTKERKAYDFSDYVDYHSEETISSVPSTYVLTVSNTSNMAVGDMLYQSATVFGFITAVNTQAGTVTVAEEVSWTVAAVSLYKAISIAVKWVANTAGNPGALKQYPEIALLFKQSFNGDATCTFSSDMAPGEITVSVAGTDLGLWGIGPWGEFPWGGEDNKAPIRVAVPRQQQRCSQLSVEFAHSYAYANWQLAGMSLVFNQGGTRISK